LTATTTDVQELGRRATLDVIRKAGFGYNFNSLALAQPGTSSSSSSSSTIGCTHGLQQQQNGADTSNRGSAHQGPVERDRVALLDGLTTPAMLLTFQLPLPRWAVPGIRGYDEGIQELEQVVADMLQVGDLERKCRSAGMLLTCHVCAHGARANLCHVSSSSDGVCWLPHGHPASSVPSRAKQSQWQLWHTWNQAHQTL
jgi:hypothetical protein